MIINYILFLNHKKLNLSIEMKRKMFSCFDLSWSRSVPKWKLENMENLVKFSSPGKISQIFQSRKNQSNFLVQEKLVKFSTPGKISQIFYSRKNQSNFLVQEKLVKFSTPGKISQIFQSRKIPHLPPKFPNFSSEIQHS